MSAFTDKVILITGAASGIGRAAAKIFAAEGASLVIADKADAVAETAEAVKAAGGKAVDCPGACALLGEWQTKMPQATSTRTKQ